MITIKRVTILVFVFGVALIILGMARYEDRYAAQTATYGNYDVPGTESWVMKLKPGIPDYASKVVYGKKHAVPLIAIGTLFIITLCFAIYRIKREIIYRKLFQWLSFVIARLGVFRVAGICPVKRTELGVFPFLNCMACEMATGACPIGMLQWGLIHGRILYLVLGVMTLAGTILGRAICGWLCPFGFVSDILDRFSLRKVKVWKCFNYLKYIILLAIFAAPLYLEPLFCIFLCPSGKFLGLLPYYLTTGISGLKDALFHSTWLGTILAFQIVSMLVFILGVIFISGRWFCRYLCPLGAWFGLFNYISLIKVVHDKQKCTGCGLCLKKCPMKANLCEGSFGERTNCIQCGRCTKICKARYATLPSVSIRREENVKKEVD